LEWFGQVNAAQVYEKYGAFINRYRGGMPAGFLAAIFAHESGGRENAVGDPRLGEYGLGQITASFPVTVGVDPEVRKTAEGNVFLAGLEYNITAAQLQKRYPTLIVPGTADQWMMARLVFGLGIGAVTKLVALVQPRSRGRMYAEIQNYMHDHPNTTVSGYPPGKVLVRVDSVTTLWNEGARIAPANVGVPEKVPAPAGLTYGLPRGIVLPGSSSLTGVFLVGAALLYFWR